MDESVCDFLRLRVEVDVVVGLFLEVDIGISNFGKESRVLRHVVDEEG